jgi:hypothetical protein
MKQSRFHERVLANALGFVNNAMRPLRGVQHRSQHRGVFAGIAAVLSSFISRWSSAKREKYTYDKYNGLYNKAREMARRQRQIKEGYLKAYREEF